VLDDDKGRSAMVKHFGVLRELFQSPEASVRQHARLWLFALLRATHDSHGRGRAMSSGVRRLTLEVGGELCASPSAVVARQYVLVVERMALWMRSRMRVSCDRGKVESLVRFLNVHLLQFVKARRRVRHRLRERRVGDGYNARLVLRVLLDVVCVPLAGAFERDGTAAERLVRGEAAVCAFLLDLVDIVVLRQLYGELPVAEECDIDRIALFHLIAYQCQRTPGALENMPGGVGFFKNLLYHRSAEVAYHAACFLLDHLQTVQPEEYRAVLAQVLNRARTLGNTAVLSDAYRQIRAVIELNQATLAMQQQQQQQRDMM
jgi:hypothetical protein